TRTWSVSGCTSPWDPCGACASLRRCCPSGKARKDGRTESSRWAQCDRAFSERVPTGPGGRVLLNRPYINLIRFQSLCRGRHGIHHQHVYSAEPAETLDCPGASPPGCG